MYIHAYACAHVGVFLRQKLMRLCWDLECDKIQFPVRWRFSVKYIFKKHPGCFRTFFFCYDMTLLIFQWDFHENILRFLYDSAEILLMFCWFSTAVLLIFYWCSAEILCPDVLLRFYWDSTETLLMFCWNSTEILLRIYWCSSEILLMVCWDSMSRLGWGLEDPPRGDPRPRPVIQGRGRGGDSKLAAGNFEVCPRFPPGVQGRGGDRICYPRRGQGGAGRVFYQMFGDED